MKRLILIFLLGLTLQAPADNTLLTQPGLKILALGNSYTDNYFNLLKEFTDNSGSDVSDMCLYKISRSFATFKAWLDMYEDKDIYNYYFYKTLGGLNASVQQGTGKAGDGTLLRKALTDEQWDLILIQASSTEATDYDAWVNNGYLDRLLQLLKEQQPQAKIGFVMSHSYWDDYAMNYQHSSLERWKLIAGAAKQLMEHYDIELVVPCGTAVENLRASTQNNDYDLTLDGTHLDYGLSRYAAAACCYETLIAPRSGISAMGNPMRHTISPSTTSKYPSVDVTDANAPIAQRAALLAVSDPYGLNNPEEDVITITDMGSGHGVCTYSSSYDLDFSKVSGKDFKAYIASGYNATSGKVTAVRVKTVPAGTGLFIKGKAGTYKITRRPTSSDYVNLLVGVPETVWLTQTDGTYTTYVLARKDGEIGFYALSQDGDFGPHKAYLQLPTSLVSQANTVGISCDDEEKTDGIGCTEIEGNTAPIYTLSGVRMTGRQLPKGLYIVRGKKMVIK